MKKLDFADHLELFFSQYVFLQRGLSPNTVSSYSDSLLLFLRFCDEAKGIKPNKLTLSNISKQLVLDYCDWIESALHCSVATRNQRLTAIHAVFRYIQGESPMHVALSRDILSIRMKKNKQVPPRYLSAEAVKAVLASPDAKTKKGLRDLAILCLLYDSAVRVQELIDLQLGDITLGNPSVVRVTGKGKKQRVVPILPATANILALYIRKYGLESKERHIFTNMSNNPLTRVGVNYILNKYVDMVKDKWPDIITIKVTPHVIRHSKATHLLSADVNLIYIRDLLGHSSVITTEVYAKTNPEFLRRAIEKTSNHIFGEVQESSPEKQRLPEFLKQYRV
jgi:site-specific recombinase XerD